jgi:hypothetical protein
MEIAVEKSRIDEGPREEKLFLAIRLDGILNTWAATERSEGSSKGL